MGEQEIKLLIAAGVVVIFLAILVPLLTDEIQ